jgi:ribose transport system substrate-binding protein
MLRLRKLCSVVVLAFLLAALLSCGSAHDSGEYFVFVAANLQVPYWQAAGAGFKKAAGQLKVRADFLGPNTYDPKAESDALDQAIQQKATGILVGVTDPGVLKAGIEKAIAAGIPVVTVDSDAPASKRLFFIGTNNYQVGITGGLRLAQELKGKATSWYLPCPTSTTCRIACAAIATPSPARPIFRSHAWSISRAIRASPSIPLHKSSAKKKIKSTRLSASKRNREKKWPEF